MADLEIVGTSPASKSMVALRRIAATVSGIDDVSRVSLGYKRWDQDDNWEKTVAGENRETQGYVAIWFDKYDHEDNDADRYVIQSELAVHMPKNDSSWMSDALDLVHALTTAWGDEDNWVAGEQRPEKISYVLRKIDTLGTKGIAYFAFGPEGGLEFLSPC